MKNLGYKIMVLALIIFLAACEKDYDSFITKITYYPTIELIGDQFMTQLVGEPFTDPGVIVKIGDEVSEPDEVTGTVDINTPGVYTITYSKVNEDGYSAASQRFVGIIDPSVLDNDYTGEYQRTKYGSNTTPAGIAVWTKITDGLYTNNNVGGVPDQAAYIYDVYVFNVINNKIVVPKQPNKLGGVINCTSTIAGTDSDQIDFTPGPVGTECYTWGVKGSGYGTNLRTFTRVN
ncbi:DUF5011 domain-containing protein [Prolixibacteraceae bacterium Z1-6]|uniref:DUF5011 domain-containing protein n=1 Tax=Draconibacterium aestuarii TaxID=2998507 RepID=A0A9X3F4R5_9BACT|nr:DUF5011 domain-containing protein [Prolixibacteraceae bacterium Z1-6]